jgi:acyl carrier protein
MIRSEVEIVLKKIFIKTFGVVELDITNTTNTDDIEKWDSLNHIILFTCIEEEFRVKFALGEMGELVSFGKIIDSLMIKLTSE